jgi:transcriptional regulator with XRE-family HTH domain
MNVAELKLVEEPLITFGELLKIKRERLGLTVAEAVHKSKLTQIAWYEKNLRYPKKNSMLRLISFYRLTETEIANCKIMSDKMTGDTPSNTPLSPPKLPTITGVIAQIRNIIERVDKISDSGMMAKKLRMDGLDALEQALDRLDNVLIIERLI